MEFRPQSVQIRDDVDQVAALLEDMNAHIVSPAKEGHWAPGYYYVLFEDPDGMRIEFNYVPGKGHFGDEGRLGPEGPGPANQYGEDGLTDR